MNCGLIGRKLGHSYSCQIHQVLADYSYQLLELEPEELDPFLRRRDFDGINVTIPYKQQVIPFLNGISDMARSIGAVNTIVNRDGRLYGYNTDFAGMTALIRRLGLDLMGKKVLILGTGGTSKTARAVAEHLGAGEICRLSRSGREGAVTYEQAKQLLSENREVMDHLAEFLIKEETITGKEFMEIFHKYRLEQMERQVGMDVSDNTNE